MTAKVDDVGKVSTSPGRQDKLDKVEEGMEDAGVDADVEVPDDSATSYRSSQTPDNTSKAR
eukprot:2882512-Karenia_brevis.AAC.1